MHRAIHPESDDFIPLWQAIQFILAVICPLLEHLLFFHFNMIIISIGMVLMLVGLSIRWTAILTANKNFHHFVQTSRSTGHVLIKHGIYHYIRHPSYFGFYVFAIGTQLFLMTIVSMLVYIIVLFRFFADRIRHEEKWLIRMFGDEYVDYRRNTPTLIPFIS
jgi:protein-S-isoprenylcysteine O-methyltransferase